MPKPQPFFSLSSDIVGYFRRQGKRLKEIGEWLDLSESFISRVARGERHFTLAHLDRLEEVVGTPLPLLLMEASRNEIPESQLEMYEGAVNILRAGVQLRKRLSQQAKPSEAVPL